MATAAGRCAAVLSCILLAPLGGEKLAAQKGATTVNGNLIPRDMGDIPARPSNTNSSTRSL